MKINGNAVKIGNILEYNNKLWVVTKTQHTQPGKGGAYLQVVMKGLLDGTKLQERFRSSETVERVQLEARPFQYLYAEGDDLVFMDQDTFDQIHIERDFVGDSAVYLQDGMIVNVNMYEGRPVGVELPPSVILEITEADPVVKGQTASSSYKPAVLENGVRIMVPPHVTSGMRVVINTEDSTYMERAKD